VRLRVGILLLAMLAAGCASSQPPAPPPVGRLALQISPNPVPATPLENDRWEFSFDVEIREEGGSDVTIDSVRADVVAFGGLRVASRTMDRAEIERRGYAPLVRANSRVRYHFVQKHDVPDPRLLEAVSAEVFVEGTDSTGRSSTARTTVTIARQ
jgi:hypothetical protein